MVFIADIYKIFNNEDKQYVKDNIKHWMNIYLGHTTPSNNYEKEFLQRVKTLNINTIDLDSDEGLFMRYLERYKLLKNNKIVLSDSKVMMEDCFTGWGNVGYEGDPYGHNCPN